MAQLARNHLGGPCATGSESAQLHERNWLGITQVLDQTTPGPDFPYISAPWEQPSKQRALGAAGIILQRGEEEEKVGQAWVDGAGAMLA